MRRPWKRHDALSELEQRLRDERPRPSSELLRQVDDGSSRRRPARLRLGLAASVSAVALAVVIALGGLGSPLDTVERIATFDNAGSSKDKDKGKGKHDDDDDEPGDDQYNEKVTICHRPPGNPSNGQTLRLPRSAAEAHLRNHRQDTRGPCPPPPQTICHKTSKNDRGTTLTLSPSAAATHLRSHRYDSRGACRGKK